MMTLDNHENIKMLGDALSASIVVATLLQALPHIAALLTIVWTLIRIWETATVQGIVEWVRRLWQRDQ